MSSTVRVTSAPPPGRAPLHAVHVLRESDTGSAGHVRSLTAGLVARGVRVTVCSSRAVQDRYGFTAAGAAFRSLPPRADTVAAAMVRRVCADADIVHAHGVRSALLATLASLGRRLPMVLTLHTRRYAEGRRAALSRLVERRAADAAAVVLAASSDLVDLARQRGARDARVAAVAAPSPPEPVADHWSAISTRAALGAAERPLLLSVGRLGAGQGWESLLDAAREWRRLRPQPLLVIAGEGPWRGGLQRRIDEQRLPVRLLGRRDDVPDLLAAADVAVLASRWEARSLLAQEALHAGVPLVATAVGGLPDLVGEAAELVPYGRPDALAGAVATLLGDPGRQARLVAAGRERAAGWPTEDDAVAHVLRVYDEFVGV